MAEILLTQGQVAVIDDADAPLVERYSWCAAHQALHGVSVGTWYAVTNIRLGGRSRTLAMHRLLLGLKPGDPGVDHRDRDGLNNRRSNLRLATQSQNNANSIGCPSRRKSLYKGVTWLEEADSRAGGRWRANLCVRGRWIRRSAKTEANAARLYNAIALQHFGEFARLNVLESA